MTHFSWKSRPCWHLQSIANLCYPGVFFYILQQLPERLLFCHSIRHIPIFPALFSTQHCTVIDNFQTVQKQHVLIVECDELRNQARSHIPKIQKRNFCIFSAQKWCETR